MKTALRLLLAPYRFSVDRLFRMGEIGGAHWFDSPSLYPGGNHLYLYQDSAGTTPVTAVGQSVGLILDRAYGGRTEESLLANGATGLTGTATAASYSTTTFAGSVSRAGDASNQSWVTWTGLVTSSIYRIRITNTGATSLYVRNGGVAGTTVASIAAGATSYVHPLTSGGSTSITITATANSTTATFTLSEFARVPGTHLIQATATSRPTLSARVNGLLATEDFSSASWTKNPQATVTANQAVAPDGNTTADLWAAVSGGSNGVQQMLSSVAGAAVTSQVQAGICLKYVSGSPWVRLMWNDGGLNQCRVWVNVQTGVVGNSTAGGTGTVTAVPTPTNLGDGWYRFVVRGTQPGASGYFGVVCQTDDATTVQATGSFYIWGADLRTADDAAKNIPAYQRVGATAADHDTDGFPHYALFDGTDDSLASAATVDGSATDKVTVVTGVTKNSDAADGTIFAFGDPSSLENGTFIAQAPGSSTVTKFQFASRGASAQAVPFTASATYNAPASMVVRATADIGAPLAQLTLNGATVSTITTTQGGGNYSSAKSVSVGQRTSGTARFNGRIYSIVGRFGAMSDADRNRLEQWTKNLMRLP